jgi:hypothetical protein
MIAAIAAIDARKSTDQNVPVVCPRASRAAQGSA